MSSTAREIDSSDGKLPPFSLQRKHSMKEKGVTACILHLRVLKRRSSILCIVRASKINFASPTYESNKKVHCMKTWNKLMSSELQYLCSLPADQAIEGPPPPPFWQPKTSKLLIIIESSRFFLATVENIVMRYGL